MLEKNCCYLCGGKLNQGYCPACGLDTNRKNRIHYRLNESNASRRLDAGDDRSLERQIKRKERQHQHKHYTGTSAKTTVNRNVGMLICVVCVFVMVFMFLGIVFAFNIDSSYEPEGTYEYEDTEYDAYEYVTKELSETGEMFQTHLTAGEYVVGTHLPEGNYTVYLIEGYGSMNVDDYENSVYLCEWFDEDEEYDGLTEMDDVRLFQGAKVSVDTGVILLFETENGQTEQMSFIQNPLTDSVKMKKGMVYESGVDFEPGIYDVSDFSEDGALYHTFPNSFYGVYEEEEEYYERIFYLNQSVGDVAFQNLVLPEGTTIWSDEADFVLMPSPKIGTTDYDAYYEYD